MKLSVRLTQEQNETR